ncbi:MAG: branched-chain amino acid aminotransferase [Prevotellaceae bacterium]|jgi:branched-chain amino acid aminotransferase|nr:branched-chain amino acid aminotransferase [Prevotellaceae bacterium]
MKIDYQNRGFSYYPTKYNVRCSYKNGEWGKLRISTSKNVTLHIAACVLHYAQEAFEGLKAFRGKDGKARIFRIDENAKRLQRSCEGIRMPKVPVDLFNNAVIKAVKLNEKDIPPYESGASLYIRPVIFGSTPMIGVRPADEYELIVFVSAVGPYFKGGFTTASPFMLSRKFDRAAPCGTGSIKIGANYAMGLAAGQEAHERGLSQAFYLDAKEKTYIEECGAANFFAIKGNTYITPNSSSVLPSITNASLAEIAEKCLGMKVEKRRILLDELAEFDEAGACGTAAVISPISEIVDIDTDKHYVFSKDAKPGAKCKNLYEYLRGIQYGEIEDKFGWNTII